VGYIVIVIFALTVITLFSAGVLTFLKPYFMAKEYGVFICHGKAGAGPLARQMKMMFQQVTSRRVFLDADELANLDNLSFTVRQHSSNLLILATKEIFSRFWCTIQIISAEMHKVPIVHVRTNKDCVDQLSDSFLSELKDVWGPIEWTEMGQHGLTLTEVESSYRAVAKLPVLDFFDNASFASQTDTLRGMLKSLVDCPESQKSMVKDTSDICYVVYDTVSPTQACVAHVMHLLLARKGWSSNLCEETPHQHASIRVNADAELFAAAVVLMSKNLIKNPVCVGVTSMLYFLKVPVTTVVSQEDTPSLDRDWIESIKGGVWAEVNDVSVVRRIAAGISDAEIANAQESLYKTLAWPFNPQDSQSLLDMEFLRIIEQVGKSGTSASAGAGRKSCAAISGSGYSAMSLTFTALKTESSSDTMLMGYTPSFIEAKGANHEVSI
jgi:hypothetical protein